MSEGTIEVGGKQYQVVKTGRAQAEQVLQLTKWFSRHGMPAIKKYQEENGSMTAESGVAFLAGVLDFLTADALIDLFQTVTGCPKEDAEIYFDVVTLIDAVVAVYNEQPAVRRLIERFFSSPNSTPSTEDTSTPSEAPTDTQTT